MGRLLLAAALACASGCIDWGSLYEQRDAATGEPDARPAADAAPNLVGCSDGTAEALIATAGLAACDGAWSIPGVVDESEPACGRAAGNDGDNRSGEGCNVADLCATGWHVCQGAGEVAARGGESACTELSPPEPDGGSFIYLTRQRGSDQDGSCDPENGAESANGAWGCGTLGLEAIGCRPLDRTLSLEGDGGGCGEPYSCGDDPAGEGRNVHKLEAERGGGVLCCSDDPRSSSPASSVTSAGAARSIAPPSGSP